MTVRDAPQVYITSERPGTGSPERLDLGTRFKGLTYVDDEKKADKLTIKLNNFDLTEFERSAWRKGNILRVSWGYPDAMCPERECIITKVKGFTELVVEAEGKEMVMARSHKNRHWENKTRAAVVKEILAEYHIAFETKNIEDTGITYSQITQGAVTDYVFVRDLARRDRFEFYIDFDGAHYHKRQLGQKPQRVFWYYTDPGRGDIIGISIENDISATTKPGGVTLQGRDLDKKEDFEVKAGNKDTPRDGEGTVLEAIDEADGTPHNVENRASAHKGPAGEATKDAAQHKANGLYTQSQVNAVQLGLHCIGDPNIVAKAVISVKGIGPIMSGNYYVNEVTHNVGAGYDMKIKCKRDGFGKAGGIAGDAASKAKVNNADAPANQDGTEGFTDVNPQDGSTQEKYRDTRGRGK